MLFPASISSILAAVHLPSSSINNPCLHSHRRNFLPGDPDLTIYIKDTMVIKQSLEKLVLL